MSSIPKCMQLPKHRLEKLADGKLATVQKLAEQHYLIWINGTAVTEVQCIPIGSGRWYWRGSLPLNWTKTRAVAIASGRARRFRGQRIDGSPLPAWSALASAAIVAQAAAKESA